MSGLVDGHTTVEHSIPLAHLYADVHQLWRQTKVAYTPTLIVAYGGNWGENYWYQATDVWNDPILTQYVPRRILDSRARRPVHVQPDELNHISIAREAKRLADDYRTRFNNPYFAASAGYIDDIIEPRETRSKVIQSLRALRDKSSPNPPRKHGNMPV